MLPFAIPFPDVSPIAVAIGPFDIKWYGLAYSVGILIAWLTIRRLLQTPHLWDGKAPFAADVADHLVMYVIIGAVLGGRLGQAILYEMSYYTAHPLEILQAWKGGMSFHGAVIGSGLAILYFAHRMQRSALTAMDLCCAGMTLTMVIGRLANFVNQEHWGRVTDVPWGMIFPNGGPLPRHPSQLYEAALEGVLMFVLIRMVTHYWLALKRPGFTAGVWLVWYALARMFVEFFREPEVGHWLNMGPFTAGQFYCLPMLVFGAYLIATAQPAANLHSKEAAARP